MVRSRLVWTAVWRFALFGKQASGTRSLIVVCWQEQGHAALGDNVLARDQPAGLADADDAAFLADGAMNSGTGTACGSNSPGFPS